MVSGKATPVEARLDAYIQGVVSGKIVTGRYVRLAVERHLADLEHAEARGYTFSLPHAELAVGYIEGNLKHSKGEWAGKSFELSESQLFITAMLFGWRRIETGYRRFTRAYVTCARKWGKSEFASAIALTVGTYDEPPEPGAEVFLVATKEAQVMDTTFRQCTRMVGQSPAIDARVQTYQKAIVVHESDPWQPLSVIKPIGSDSDTSDGGDQHAAVLDEMHAWQKRHQKLYERMTTAGGSRRQELVLIFTTAGDEDSELWLRLDDFYVRVLEAAEVGEVVSDQHFGFIARIDDDDEPFDEECWAKANPNYPVTPKREYLLQQAAEAEADPLERQKFLRFHCNVVVETLTKPIERAAWQSCEGEVTMKGECFGGIDLARTQDFAAWAVVSVDGDSYEIMTRTYTCENREKVLKTPQVAEWIRNGHLIEHPGKEVNLGVFEQDVLAATKQYGVNEWAYDPQYATQMRQNLERELGEKAVHKFTQGPGFYNEPIVTLLRKLKTEGVVVEENPCVRWQAGNLRLKMNARGESAPNKSTREYKIDAMVAILMAFGLAIWSPPKPNSRPYSGAGTGMWG